MPSSCTQQRSCSTSGGQSGSPSRCSPDLLPCHSLPLPAFPISVFGARRLLLLNQFHDVVTGSCIQLVAEDAMNYYEGEAYLRPVPPLSGPSGTHCSPMAKPISLQTSVLMATHCSVLQPQPCVLGSRVQRASLLSTRCPGSVLKCWRCPSLVGLTA